MDSLMNGFSRRVTKITLFSIYNLVNDSLRGLLESVREIKVLDNACTFPELIEKVSLNAPDVVLICFMENEGSNICLIPEIFKAAPGTKVVILSTPNNMLDQPAALKLGVTGIVGTNQNFRTLVRAIRQVSEGEVWLNQKLIAELLGRDLYFSVESSKTNNLNSENELTKREHEVVRLVGIGMNNKDISKKLNISEATVRHHLSSIYSKLYVEDRLNLAIFAYRKGIVQPQTKLI